MARVFPNLCAAFRRDSRLASGIPMWQPISEADLTDLIAVAEAHMRPPDRAFWEMVRVPPTKWQLSPWGDPGGGFWVVAVWGTNCVWFNDVEGGFNLGEYDAFGHINEDSCGQDTLDRCLAWKGNALSERIRDA